MLTTIPFKDLKALAKSVKEDNASKKSFSWDEMIENARSASMIREYVSTTDCKFVGQGSSRVAYFLPSGTKTNDKTLDCPSCFKVAKNNAGVAQNQAEINMISLYEDKYSCFPKLYDFDVENQFYMLCEVGSSLQDVPANEITSFFKKLNEWINSNASDLFKNGIKEDNFLEHIGRILNLWKFDTKNKIVNGFLDALEKVSKIHKKYKTLFDFFNAMTKGNLIEEVQFGDFIRFDNWGFVIRDGENMLIPIDWGFTKEVANRYY